MKSKTGLRLLALLLILFLLNGCGGGVDDESTTGPNPTSPPSSVGSEGSHLVRPTPANPEEKVEPTRAISAETIPQQNQVASNTGPQTNIATPDQPVHRHTHRLYLMVILRR
jgi:hypothetical protein